MTRKPDEEAPDLDLPDNSRTLYIIRGLPGSGKSTLARLLAPEANFANDDFFCLEDGTYKYDLSKRGEAASWCLRQVEQHMKFVRRGPVAVHNTFTTHEEMAPYKALAEALTWNLNVITLQNDFGSVHNVPQDAIERMRARWEW